jgi:hypothetical protein
VEKAGSLWSIAAALYILTFYRRVREVSPAALATMSSIDFYRREVLRRQAMAGRFWKVVLLFLPAFILNDSFVSPQPAGRYVMLAIGFALLMVWMAWLNRREARRLEVELKQIEG